jgi:hypothetical protein
MLKATMKLEVICITFLSYDILMFTSRNLIHQNIANWQL